MNKAELVTAIANKSKVSKSQIEKYLDATLSIITKTVAEGEESSLGGLSWRSGLFPSRVRTLAPGALSPVKALVGIRSLPWVGRAACPPSHNSALPPTVYYEALPQ